MAVDSTPNGPGRQTAAASDAAQAELLPLFGLYQAGRHAEMEAAARALTQRYPRGGQAWKALSVAQLAQGRDALAALQQAATLLPGDAEAASNLGRALLAQGRPEAAADCYRRAVQLRPDFAPAHLALGIVLRQLGRFDGAAASLREATRWQPRGALAHDQLGVVLHAAGHAEAALSPLREALRLQPDFAEAHLHLANALVDLGRPEEALPRFGAALALRPAEAEWQVNHGVALLTLGRHDDAAAALQRAVGLKPGLALAHSNLGNARLAQGRFADALESQRRAVALAPDRVLFRRNLAHAAKTLGLIDEALDQLGAAIGLDPDDLALRSEWLFVQQYLDPTPARRRAALEAARDFGAAAKRVARPGAGRAGRDDPERALRIGLVSGDLRQHPVGYFIEAVLAELATCHRGTVVLQLYAHQRQVDDLTRRLQGLAEGWLAVADLDDATLAGRIRDDAIDVLVDLSGHTRHNRLPLLACRAAPVQLSWLGYCATTGLDAVDAVIVDPWIAPAGTEQDFVEPLLRLPDSFLCFTPPAPELAVGPLPASRGQGLTFGCFNHLAKINDAVLALWSRVLQAVPHSRLLLQSEPLSDPAVRQQVQDRCAQAGIGGDRLLLRPAQARPDYLAAHGDVDIALDPFPYPGGTTSCEALWMGAPVLTMAGSTALSRQGVGILSNLGLADWIAADADTYVALAQRHAADLAGLAALRSGLRSRLLASPLCDAPRFAGHLEAAWRGLWRQWCARQPGPGAAP